MPQLVFSPDCEPCTPDTCIIVNASNSIDVNNAAEITSNIPVPDELGKNARLDRLDYCTFNIPPGSLLKNPKITLKCIAGPGRCH